MFIFFRINGIPQWCSLPVPTAICIEQFVFLTVKTMLCLIAHRVGGLAVLLSTLPLPFALSCAPSFAIGSKFISSQPCEPQIFI